MSQFVRSDTRKAAATAARVVAVVLLAGLVVACDRPRVDDALLADAAPRSFEIDTTNVTDGVLASHSTLEVRFTRPVDASSVGRRSVRVLRKNGRSLRHLRIWSDAETLFVAPAPGAEFPAGELTARIAGRPSPRGLRGADGSVLGARADLRFRSVRRRRLDLVGPKLLSSRPRHDPLGEDLETMPGSAIELRFSETLSRGSVRAGDAIDLRVNGEPLRARLRLSPNLTRIVVRPRSPLPPDASVEVEVLPALLDRAGNPATRALVKFRTKATRLVELAEDFVAADMADDAATTSAWADPLSPGFLVARAGRVQWTPGGGGRFDRDIGPRPLVRFQIVFPLDDVPGALATGVRLTFVQTQPGAGMRTARVQAGPVRLEAAEPTFEANRRAAELRLVATYAELSELEPLENGLHFIELPFTEPVRIDPGAALLLDVELEVDPGLRLAAALDGAGLALLQDAGPLRLLPAAELLVTGGTPQARSAWYDSGIEHPIWQTAFVEMPYSDGLSAPVVAYQSAPAGPDGMPAVDEASEWDADLGRLPGLRFVRFRVGFPDLGPPGGSPRIDRIVMPYEF